MTRKRPGWNLLNGVDPEKDSAAHQASGKIEKSEKDGETYYVPQAHVALNPGNGSQAPSPYDEDKVVEQTLTAMKKGHIRPFLDGYHHVLDMYREKKRKQKGGKTIAGFISKAQKHTFLQSNENAPRPRKTLFTTTILWIVKIYAWFMGGLFTIPESCTLGGHHDNHGKRPRWGATQMMDDVPGFGSAANTGPALTLYLMAGLHLGLPFGSLMRVLGIRMYSGGVGALGPIPTLWGEPFMVSKLQAELRIANMMETWVDLRSRTENDQQLSPDDPLYDEKHSRWSSEQLSKIFYLASDGQMQVVTYSNEFRKAVWGHYM